MSTMKIYTVAGSFFISLVITKLSLPLLHKLKFGQQVREEGPGSHLKKQGTPTMGGAAMLISFLGASLLFQKEFLSLLPLYILTFGFGIIGFLDDFLKIKRKQSLGLTAKAKLFLEFVVTAGFYFAFTRLTENPELIKLPFLSGEFNLGILFLPFVFFAVLGTVNGANFTDGLDGLLSFVTLAMFIFFFMITKDISLFQSLLIMMGVIGGFLVFNIHPAQLFMGDTGSLAIGGFVSALAFLTRTPVFILIVGFVYLFEILSVMIQVSYFKLTKGKRIFKMAPIHHHFELSGMKETSVVIMFSLVTALLSIIGFLAIR